MRMWQVVVVLNLTFAVGLGLGYAGWGRRADALGRVADVMTTDLVVGQADDDYRSAMRAMDQTNIRHLPVVSGDRLLSMLSIRDLMRVELEDKGQEIRTLHEYLYQVPPGAG